MSRIGRLPIPIPEGVKVAVKAAEATDTAKTRQGGNGQGRHSGGAEDCGMVVQVSGPKGSLEQSFHPDIKIAVDKSPEGGNQIVVTRPTDQKQHKALHGLTRALINNMVIGVDQGFSKTLDIVGVGYRASLNGKNLVLQLGHSHAIEVVPPPDIEFEVVARARGDRQVAGTIIIRGIDKQLVGQVAAEIRAWRPPEPYKGKGIRYRDEYVRRKAGKAGKIG